MTHRALRVVCAIRAARLPESSLTRIAQRAENAQCAARTELSRITQPLRYAIQRRTDRVVELWVGGTLAQRSLAT